METGRIARQATGAVLVNMGDTVVLVTCVASREARPDQGFFPLTVDYMEKTYAAGKIPGGFFRREGRPSEKEVLTCRLIDRPVRPLFPKHFKNEVQIIATVMSLDPQVDPDIPALIGASAALGVSGVPFNGPIGAARVGYRNGEYLLNPGYTALARSELDLVVAGTETSVLMVESEASLLSEEVMLGAVMFGHESRQVVIENIKQLVAEAGTRPWDWQAPEEDTDLADEVNGLCADLLREAYSIQDKISRRDRVAEVRSSAIETITANHGERWGDRTIIEAFEELESGIVRGAIVAGEPRIDGRDTAAVRDISVEVGRIAQGPWLRPVYPGQRPRRWYRPPWARTGTRRSSMPSKASARTRSCCITTSRLIASVKRDAPVRPNGARSAAPAGQARPDTVMPNLEEFPYAIRIVSEITESNGPAPWPRSAGPAWRDGRGHRGKGVAGIAMA